MPSDHDRIQEILHEMQRLLAESKALGKRHAEIMDEYRRLNEELTALHKRENNTSLEL